MSNYEQVVYTTKEPSSETCANCGDKYMTKWHSRPCGLCGDPAAKLVCIWCSEKMISMPNEGIVFPSMRALKALDIMDEDGNWVLTCRKCLEIAIEYDKNNNKMITNPFTGRKSWL